MHKHEESKKTRIMMATVRHITSGLGFIKFQAAWFYWPECTFILWIC